MRKLLLVEIAVLIFSISITYGQNVEKGLQTITIQALQAQVEFLASDWMEGREAGTRGAYLAADYIASQFKVMGLKPLGADKTHYPTRAERFKGKVPSVTREYFQNFNLIKYKPNNQQSFSITIGKEGMSREQIFDYNIDYNIYGISNNLKLDAPVVFVGYGFCDEKGKYNDFAKVDVNGKIIMQLIGFPGHQDTSSEAFKRFSSEKRSKREILMQANKRAIEAGAIGVILLSQHYTSTVGRPQNIPFQFKYDGGEYNSKPDHFYDYRIEMPDDSLKKSIPVIHLSTRVQNELLQNANIDINAFAENVKNSMKPESCEVKDVRVSLTYGVDSEMIQVRNVVGMIEGKNKDEAIVVGAHYDHVGKYNGMIYNGADDNASGTVGMMSIARAMLASGKKPEKTVIFAAWTAEERGLCGSKYFVNHIPDNKKIVLNLNYDMIARDSPRDSLKNQCRLGYSNSIGGIKKLNEAFNSEYDFGMSFKYRGMDQPKGGSDYAPFAKKGIPVFFYFAAMHTDYHQPTDELSKINWDKMTKIVKLGFLNISKLANSDLKEFAPESE